MASNADERQKDALHAKNNPRIRESDVRKVGITASLKYEEQHFIDTRQPVWNYSRFTDDAIANFQNGTHYNLYEYFGNTQLEVLNTPGTYFAVWAPNATYVSVAGDFNSWNRQSHPLSVRQDSSGIWEGFIPNIGKGVAYKYHIHGYKGIRLDKGDPFAHFWELRPATASITWQTDYAWQDAGWMESRAAHNALNAPFSVYEVHLGSWMRPDKNNENAYNTYDQARERLVPYVKKMGFTHVEFMPVMEHPYDGSWGYQGAGYFAPTSRFGTPQEFAALVDALHQEGIGVILDWVPSHFPYDAHGLFMFDGTHTYEYADMRKGYHPDWNSYIFNYKRGEVKSFLISSARFWCDRFHADGLRVDAVSSMLRLEYSREEGAWEPNEFGGNGNIEAIAFVKDLNETLYRDFPAIQVIAEEATDWPRISKPTYEDGLGFGMKWMMGWMHDTLDYFKEDPIYRQFHQDKFTFSMMYFYDEHFMLPLSHDEVVHGKSPMLYKMPGDEWQKFANLRLLYTYMFTHPGAKLLFMGNEFGATAEWNYKSELQWELLKYDSHAGMQYCVQQLNHLYRSQPALYEKQFKPDGFAWVDLNHRSESVIAYQRKGNDPENDLLIILNMTPVARPGWQITVQGNKTWKELFNSDSKSFWGTGDLQNPAITASPANDGGQLLNLNLPPLAAIVLG
ncbi:1,4-alpha-glucan branching protein GlgB [Sediminibacterium ginsengisoli]|uniref:1,4-alpha-glucan branching enzyme GlgB n=1 Tax=Sediminibacterium ginsengisoli TaxID=413434 RepID=A0A1T4QPC6_9BACT|nr:1,4-alpha-glucan branching protein GlgB [Sediminibacterium ginsengisoli]SKA05623.1 1,4-alpha-glucan branching enzyme [Sediminibacterium ginsengisoli]